LSDKITLSNTTNAINQSGFFLQTHVVYQLKKQHWTVNTEMPVQLAPFLEDPLKNPIHFTRPSGPIFEPSNLIQSIFASQNKIELEETSIDVIGIASSSDDKLSFLLCIECKKLDPEYVDWIFFDVKSKQPMNLIAKNIVSQGFVSLFKIPPTTKKSNEIHVDLNKFNWDPFKHPHSNSSLAISNEKLDKNTYKTKKSLVDNASRQIIKGMYGLILNKLQHQILTGDGYENFTEIFVPIVVTTANLKICKANPEDIDPKTGYTTKEPEYENVDSIIFECLPPKSVKFPHPEFNSLSLEHRYALLKWHVLILSPNGFVKFLNDLKTTSLVSPR